jgi:cell division protein FtsB
MPYPPKKSSPFDSKAKLKLLLIILLLCLALLLLNKNGLISLFKEKQIHQHLIEEKTELEEKKLSLEEEKEKLLNDRQYIEKIAREQYNMVLPGETVYKVIEE